MEKTETRKLAEEYMLLGGTRQVMIDDNKTFVRQYDHEPEEAERFLAGAHRNPRQGTDRRCRILSTVCQLRRRILTSPPQQNIDQEGNSHDCYQFCKDRHLATDGYERSELRVPYEELQRKGADVKIASIKDGEIKSWDEKDWGDSVKVDLLAKDVRIEDFDALVLPGGQINPDVLRAQ